MVKDQYPKKGAINRKMYTSKMIQNTNFLQMLMMAGVTVVSIIAMIHAQYCVQCVEGTTKIKHIIFLQMHTPNNPFQPRHYARVQGICCEYFVKNELQREHTVATSCGISFLLVLRSKFSGIKGGMLWLLMPCPGFSPRQVSRNLTVDWVGQKPLSFRFNNFSYLRHLHV